MGYPLFHFYTTSARGTSCFIYLVNRHKHQTLQTAYLRFTFAYLHPSCANTYNRNVVFLALSTLVTQQSLLSSPSSYDLSMSDSANVRLHAGSIHSGAGIVTKQHPQIATANMQHAF